MVMTRIQRTVQVTLSHTFRSDEGLVDASGPVTYDVNRLDGTDVVNGTTTHDGLGTYSFPLPGQSNLDTYSLDWSGSFVGSTVTIRDYIEIVGDFIFTLSEVREAHRGLSDIVRMPTARLAYKRTGVEQEAERIAGRAFVPRFARFALSGDGTSELQLPDVDIRAIRSVKMSAGAGSYVAFTADQLAAIRKDSGAGIIVRADGDVFIDGTENVIIEYEYGLDVPPQDVRDAAILRMRSYIAASKVNIPDRTVSYVSTEGAVYRLGTAGARRTGIQDVDSAYLGHAGANSFWLARR